MLGKYWKQIFVEATLRAWREIKRSIWAIIVLFLFALILAIAWPAVFQKFEIPIYQRAGFVIAASFASFVFYFLYCAIQIPAEREARHTQEISDLHTKVNGNLKFIRTLESPEGDIGYYEASIFVKNTSRILKLVNCRCEIAELRNEDNELLGRNIGLRTKHQENKPIKGRFNLDQDSTKEIPLFSIDQADDLIAVINSDEQEWEFPGTILVAHLRAYGDSGEPDEITVSIDASNCRFEIINS